MNVLIILIAKYFVYVSALIAVVFFFKQPQEKQKEILIIAAILFLASYIIVKIVGHFYFNPRPFVVGHFIPLIPHAPDNGFPSDHTLLAAAIALAVYYFNKKLGAFLLVLAVFLGAARVAAGVHHWVDIFGSVAIVIIVFLIVLFLWKKKKKLWE